MKILQILLVALILMSCQQGLIPCPAPKGARLERSNPGHKAYNSMLARGETTGNKEAESVKIPQSRYVSNVTEEEWDCPEPGTKRYLPKHVKANIRKNMRKIASEQQRQGSDTTGTAAQQ